MRYEEISPVMRGFLGAFEALRRLGFKSEDIYADVCMSARTLQRSCFAALRTQGKEFLLEIGPLEMSYEQFHEEYLRVASRESIGQILEEDLNRIYTESEAFQRRVDLVTAILLKGFVLPHGASTPPIEKPTKKKKAKKKKR
jgi:hypothetical protein